MDQIRRSRHQNVVLIADDDLYIRSLVRKALVGMADLFEVDDGQQILNIYKQTAPNMLLLDIHMPGVHGPDLIKPIIAMDPNAYIIMLSADAVRDNILQCLNCGAKGFIGKPFSKNTLLRDFNRCPTIKFTDMAISGL